MKTKFDIFIDKVKELLSKNLPGSAAHRAMESEIRRKLINQWDESGARLSAVLLLLYRGEDDRVMTVLTLKQNGIGIHSGQLSLPGGKFEPEDIILENTALRETEEEIGVHPDNIILIGKLSSLAIPRSGFIVHPFVGFCRKQPDFTIQDAEVAKLYEVDLQLLLENSNKKNFFLTDEDGETFEIPSYLLDKHHLWGATAMIMSEVEHLLRNGGLLND